jgi:hypothetical protein
MRPTKAHAGPVTIVSPAAILPMVSTVCVGIALVCCGCMSSQPIPGPSTQQQSLQAQARGLTFHRRLGAGKTPESGRYHLLRLKEAHAPRIHADLDLSVFVLSGRIRVYSENGQQELPSGRSVDISHGTWYASEPADGGEATLLLMFNKPRRHLPQHSASPEAASRDVSKKRAQLE